MAESTPAIASALSHSRPMYPATNLHAVVVSTSLDGVQSSQMMRFSRVTSSRAMGHSNGWYVTENVGPTQFHRSCMFRDDEGYIWR